MLKLGVAEESHSVFLTAIECYLCRRRIVMVIPLTSNGNILPHLTVRYSCC